MQLEDVKLYPFWTVTFRFKLFLISNYSVLQKEKNIYIEDANRPWRAEEEGRRPQEAKYKLINIS